MKTALTLLLAICLPYVARGAGVEIQEPALILIGHYKSTDGRVKEHKFPVEITLLNNGKFTGTIESWIEVRLSDGSSRLSYSQDSFRGSWAIKAQSLNIIMQKGNELPIIQFPDLNGLKIIITQEDS